MKVSELIDILRGMPQDADIITHANNHDTDGPPNGHIRVAQCRDYWTKNAVIIGNFDRKRYTDGSLRLTGDVHVEPAAKAKRCAEYEELRRQRDRFEELSAEFGV